MRSFWCWVLYGAVGRLDKGGIEGGHSGRHLLMLIRMRPSYADFWRALIPYQNGDAQAVINATEYNAWAQLERFCDSHGTDFGARKVDPYSSVQRMSSTLGGVVPEAADPEQ